MVKNRVVSLLFRIGCLALSMGGVLSMTRLFGEDGLNFSQFMYYTMQSNLLAVVLFAMLVFRTAKGLKQNGVKGKTGYFSRFEMVCAVDLFLTLFVFWVLLAPQLFTMGSGVYNLWTFGNIAVHLITPLLCIADYMLFAGTGNLKYRDVYFVLIFPFLYLGFSSAAGFWGNVVYNISPTDGLPMRFPYFFMDYDRIGAKALLYIIALTVFFLILSHLFYFADQKLGKRKR
jgi:hypothetical protein